jgi:hypothetical protein
LHKVWRANADRDLPEWKTLPMVQEDGSYKLDEN